MAAKKKPSPTIIRVDITGPVGSGKTTIACELAQALAQAGRHVVHSEREARMSKADRVVLIVDEGHDKAEPYRTRRGHIRKFTDADIRGWIKRSNCVDGSASIAEARAAIDDARSLHLTPPA